MSNSHVIKNKTIRQEVGIVIIGRNEGTRLYRSVQASVAKLDCVVYVDSGSTDDSLAVAHSLGAKTIALKEGPFTAARGRQRGVEYLSKHHSELKYIQFLDGDCVLVNDWLISAYDYLQSHDDVGAVCGRRKEEYIGRSIYNRLVDMDWLLPSGEVDSIGGGDALVRCDALLRAGGWRVELIAGEDLEFSQRVLAAGFKIVRLCEDMVLHDIAMSNFRQYWRRHYRAGHAYAELALLCNGGPGRRWSRRVISVIGYGIVLPPVAVISGTIYWPVSISIILIYLSLIFRLTRHRHKAGDKLKYSFAYGAVVTVCKTAVALGACKFYLSKLVGHKTVLIEYKPLHVKENEPESENDS
ncbi:MAG: glycosyltransferase family 2 protein [Candidatus Sedimenticola sp. (ex Thyasira tokunagai)]